MLFNAITVRSPNLDELCRCFRQRIAVFEDWIVALYLKLQSLQLIRLPPFTMMTRILSTLATLPHLREAKANAIMIDRVDWVTIPMPSRAATFMNMVGWSFVHFDKSLLSVR